MQDARITLHPRKPRMQVRVDGILLADAANTLELREHGYPTRHYFPRKDVQMDLLTVLDTTTYRPFKGHTVYFSMGERRDIAWSYEAPIEGMEAIAGRGGIGKTWMLNV